MIEKYHTAVALDRHYFKVIHLIDSLCKGVAVDRQVFLQVVQMIDMIYCVALDRNKGLHR